MEVRCGELHDWARAVRRPIVQHDDKHHCRDEDWNTDDERMNTSPAHSLGRFFAAGRGRHTYNDLSVVVPVVLDLSDLLYVA